MKLLFDMDKKDYNPDGKVFSRPSARAIIVKDGNVLLIHSAKYDYYKFPGGGIEKGESPEEALVREVAEESGYKVIPESIKEFGEVIRRQKDSIDESAIFEQRNYYYFCDVEEETVSQKLDDYESDEGFTPVWKEPFAASRHDLYLRSPLEDLDMYRRESKVLDLVDLELRKQAQNLHEQNTIESLGHPEYKEMLAYVEAALSNDTEDFDFKKELSYSRFDHTKRVLAWAIRLYDSAMNQDEINLDDLMIATIFHDVGRPAADKDPSLSHAHAGGPITLKYLLDHGYSKERAEYIAGLVHDHSNKWAMHDENIDMNLLLLMEADLLDDIGAQGIVMDCMITKGRNPKATFIDCLNHMTRFTQHIQHENPMVTPQGIRFWEEKTKLVDNFIAALNEDLIL